MELESPIYLDTSKSFEERAEDLVSRLTLKEKISQMVHCSSEIKRLGIYKYNWWSECLHGVMTKKKATIFPQSIGLAAMFNRNLQFRIASAISDEARAINNTYYPYGSPFTGGLTFWSPNVNLFRDPRWGRGQETYGEDPYLTGRLAVAFVKGLQGDDPTYLKLIATPKHFAAGSGPEQGRHQFNAMMSNKDLYESYLPQFRDCIIEAKAYSIMGAYNRLNGEPCCASPTLQRILRIEWGFDGYMVSDCGAIRNIYKDHKYVKTGSEAAAIAVRNGCELNCGLTYKIFLNQAVEQHLISEEEITQAVTKLFLARMKLGEFDPPELVPHRSIPYEVVNSKKHQDLAIKAVQQSIVLLKNANNILPLQKNLKKIAVIGPNAAGNNVLLGNYVKKSYEIISILNGIKSAVHDDTTIKYSKGCYRKRRYRLGEFISKRIVKDCDVVIMVMGIGQEFESEEKLLRGNGDRQFLSLPAHQIEFMNKIHDFGKPIILVLVNGSPLAINWAQHNVDAILEVWYPGEKGGVGVADVIFGNYNPSGRLPVTFPKSVDDIPPIEDFRMENRTYRYMQKKPLYPFGYGLSYTDFSYDNFYLNSDEIHMGDPLIVSVDVKNKGKKEGDEVVQLYIQDLEASVKIPRWSLQGFERISLKPGQSETVKFKIKPQQFSIITEQGKRILEPGSFRIYIGGSQPDEVSEKLTGRKVLFKNVEVIGEPTELLY
ncbi:MAG: glycoside hydrolase family 3 C-terminal domain-containing protein [Candidatus Lokiarchaeota archaeon]|nr:glycoside hydrolase family 3 C-terminal domain-containing protein [Candidatus Lokiarchaeota archaeon]